MKILSEILTNTKQTIGDKSIPINAIVYDSRKAKKGALFVAVKGTQTDGHDYIQKAIENGASAIMCEVLPEKISENVTYIEVTNSAEELGKVASAFYDYPSRDIRLVGITGTNGKTTTATLLHRLYIDLGYQVGLLSTIENKIGERIIPAQLTTPDAVSLNALLADMVAEGCDYAFMEVSSHAIDQRRIAGLEFTGAIFTNISHDHLDYHNTFKEYIDVKKHFFDELPKAAFSLTNIDDKRGEVMLQNTDAQKNTYSLHRIADYRASIRENNLSGLIMELDGEEFYARLIGEFNAYNLLAVYATARLLGNEKNEILRALSNLKTAEGRFDYIVGKESRVIGIVDYAHTPDALEKVLETIRQLRKKGERIITICGCGGDRDKTKRPIMAEIACKLSDQIILTSDNPRTENPDTIIEDMEAGIPENAVTKTLSITNRKQAIKTACQLAQNGDIILLAGKGHEKYQDINSVKNPFDDKQTLKEFLK